MNPKSNNQIRKLLYGVMLLGVVFSNFGATVVFSARAQVAGNETPTLIETLISTDTSIDRINPGNYQIPEELLTELNNKLTSINDQTGGATSFGVTYYEEHQHWTWVNLSVADGDYFIP